LLIENPRRWVWVVVLCTVLGLLLFAVNAGNLLVVDEPQSSDVIVVLAGETFYRPTAALKLLDRGYGRRMIIDVPAAAVIYEYSQVQLAERYVHDLPEAGAIEICAIEGLSTRDESHDVEKCLAHETGSRILIVTSDFHTRRALSIFRREIPGKTFSIAAAHDDSEFGTRWWGRREWAKTCFYEWIRLVWWNTVERWK
jgi:hypothetical protein